MSQLNKNLDMKKIYSNYTFVFSFLVLVVIATVINHSFLSLHYLHLCFNHLLKG